MNEIISEICELLLEQKTIQETLLALSRDKREAAIKNDTQRISEIVSAEYLELSRIKKLEKQRTSLLTGAVEVMGRPAAEISVSDLLEHAEDGDRKRLSELRDELLGIIGELKLQNDENRALIETQLEFTNTLLEAIVTVEDPLSNFYGTDGQSKDFDSTRGARRLLDTEI